VSWVDDLLRSSSGRKFVGLAAIARAPLPRAIRYATLERTTVSPFLFVRKVEDVTNDGIMIFGSTGWRGHLAACQARPTNDGFPAEMRIASFKTEFPVLAPSGRQPSLGKVRNLALEPERRLDVGPLGSHGAGSREAQDRQFTSMSKSKTEQQDHQRAAWRLKASPNLKAGPL